MKAFDEAYVVTIGLLPEEIPPLPEGMRLTATSVTVDSARTRYRVDLWWGRWFIVGFVGDTIPQALEALSQWLVVIKN